jgi:O-antigen ligase
MGTILHLFSGIGSESSSTARTDDYGAVAQKFGEQPWLGQGFGTTSPQNFRVLDNQYLGTLVETGLIGLFAVLAVLVTGWLLARGARKASTDDETRHLAQCFAGAIAAAAISFGTFDAFAFPMAACLTYFMIGGGAALWRLTHQPADAFTQPIKIPVSARAG